MPRPKGLGGSGLKLLHRAGAGGGGGGGGTEGEAGEPGVRHKRNKREQKGEGQAERGGAFRSPLSFVQGKGEVSAFPIAHTLRTT